MKIYEDDFDAIYRDTLKNHVLEQVLDAPKFKAFYLKEPGMGRMQSTLILFTPEGIIIGGDLCPGNDPRNSGVTSPIGYGLNWFAGRLSPVYLCEKFLYEGFHPAVAARDCREIADQILRGIRQHVPQDDALEAVDRERAELADELASLRHAVDEEARRDLLRRLAAETRMKRQELLQAHADEFLTLADRVEGGDMGAEGFRDELSAMGVTLDDWYPGYGYDPRSAGLLVAIQKRFSELYSDLAKKPVVQPA